MRSVEVVAKEGSVGMPRSRWGRINRHAVIWRDISCRKHFGYVFFFLVEISVPIYYDDPESLILEPNQHYSTPQNRPTTQPHRPNPYRHNPTHLTQPTTHHTPPTHHTHPTYHPEGTMHLRLRPPTTTTTNTQPTLPTPPIAQKVLCTFAPPTTTTTTTQPTPPTPPTTQKVLCTFAFAPRPPPLPPPTTTPPNHPPTHPFGTRACFITDVFVILLKTKQIAAPLYSFLQATGVLSFGRCCFLTLFIA